jgi:hypothetical protein
MVYVVTAAAHKAPIRSKPPATANYMLLPKHQRLDQGTACLGNFASEDEYRT